jgi:hypothetical protein
VLLIASGVLRLSGCRNVAPAPLSAVAGADPTASALTEFSKRVDDYLALHKRMVRTIGELDDTKKPSEISGREVELGKAIRAERANAKPGAIFTPEVAAVLKKIIVSNYRRSPEVRETTKDAEAELPDFTPGVNDVYPPTHPLATFPATLLKVLPPLPEELEYRFVTHHLILRDIEANLIVDVLPNAVP